MRSNSISRAEVKHQTFMLLDQNEDKRKEEPHRRKSSGSGSIASQIIRIKMANFFTRKNIEENRDLAVKSLYNENN